MGIKHVAFWPDFDQTLQFSIGTFFQIKTDIARPLAKSDQMGKSGLAQDLLGLFQSLISFILAQ